MTYLALGAVSAILTWLITLAARRSGILDRPGPRSSHHVPTPRAGGLAILISFVIAVCLRIGMTRAPLGRRALITVAGAALLTGAVGLLDDLRGGLSRSLRFGVHIVAAVWILYWASSTGVIHLGPYALHLSYVGICLTGMAAVWSINLHNFMDGIDGLAAGHAVVVTVAGGMLLRSHGAPVLAYLCYSLAAGAAGFLTVNWNPANVFMGDVGSGFLGAGIAALAVLSDVRGAIPVTTWAILSAVFVVDATATLIARFFRGEVLFQAHRLHAYQRLVQSGLTHRHVTMAVMLVDVALAFIASWSLNHPSLALPTVVGVYAVLVGIWYVIWTRYPRPGLRKHQFDQPG